MVFDFSNIATAIITDVKKDMYEDVLEEPLDSAFIKRFETLVGSAELSDELSSGRPLYSIVMLDKQDKEMLRATVTDSYCVMINDKVFGRESFAQLLVSIEKDYCLDEGIWERKPSSNYFALIQDAHSADLREIVNDHFAVPRHIELSDKQLKDLKNAAKNAEFSDKNDNIKKLYSLRIYSKDESSLYVLFLDSDGKLYTEYGYEVLGLLTDEVKSIV